MTGETTTKATANAVRRTAGCFIGGMERDWMAFVSRKQGQNRARKKEDVEIFSPLVPPSIQTP
jgi:hypothetical protein